MVKQAYAFNGIVPGPILKVDEGDRVRIIVDNQLPFPTSTHWHGMILPNDQDGVGGITQPHIEPGQQYVVRVDGGGHRDATGTTRTRRAGTSARASTGRSRWCPKAGDIEADHDYTPDPRRHRPRVHDQRALVPVDPGAQTEGGRDRAPAGDRTPVTRCTPSTSTACRSGWWPRTGIPKSPTRADGHPDHRTGADLRPPLRASSTPGDWVMHCHMFIHSHMNGGHAPPTVRAG